MIRGEFKFRWLWPVEAWHERALKLKESRQGQYRAAERAVESVISAAARKRFRVAVSEVVNDTIVPAVANGLEVALTEDTTERRIVRVMAQRDFLYTWLLSPNWRAQLSYQQLQQSRSWTPKLLRGADPLARPFAENICEVERAIKQGSLTLIGKDFNPALIEHINNITDALREGSFEDRQALTTFFVIAKLRHTVLVPALEAYDSQVGR
jgi:hypothetical protein